ncbi:MAG: hypothetical protein ACW99J_13535 [Candidatus Thorarchaeota archaeon]|jgi:hypothetical protein
MYLKAKTFVEAHIYWEGRHFWAEAPDDLDYLRRPHAHSFDVTVAVEVNGENRVIACEDLRDWMYRICDSFPSPIPWSCETIARKIATRMAKNAPIFKRGVNPKLKGKDFYVRVWEDGTQGASFRGEFAK